MSHLLFVKKRERKRKRETETDRKRDKERAMKAHTCKSAIKIGNSLQIFSLKKRTGKEKKKTSKNQKVELK